MADVRRMLAGLGLGLTMTAGALAPVAVQAQENTIKVGILHSLSGTMAI